MRSHGVRAGLRLRTMARGNPAAVAALAYSCLMLLGAVLLAQPAVREASRLEPVSGIDALFVSASAISTTGLVTVDPGTTFNVWGELIILLLIQIGGIGYMTLMSFAYLTVRDRLGPAAQRLTRAGFGLTAQYDTKRFVIAVVASTIAIEAVGAVVLSILFARWGVADPVWQGIFHSISAFCTAGFSLFANSMEDFKGSPGILYAVSALSYAGAIGFVVVAEVVDRVSGRQASFSATTRLILSITIGLGCLGTLFLWLLEPSIAALPADQRFHNAFFQAMTASTTVGFNSVPIGGLAPASIMIVYLLMFVGASPAGTGGGLKSTTAAVLMATAVAALTGRSAVVSGGARIAAIRVQQAAATLVIALLVVFAALVSLDLTGSYTFEKALFEVLSALGTVGLSMGLTSELNDAGKLIITFVMIVGRIGILAFFVALALSVSDSRKSTTQQEADVIL